MKIIRVILLGCTVGLLTACSSKDIMIDNFESGTYSNWTIEGEAFGSKPIERDSPDKHGGIELGGKFLINSFYAKGDDAHGSLTSKEFTIERDYINFLLGGGSHDGTYLELIVEGKPVEQTRSIMETGDLNQMTWDVKAYKGKKAIIKIVDKQSGGWGHIVVDEIYMSDRAKNVLIKDYELAFDINQKYILLPIEDNARESIIQLSVNNQKIGEPMYIRIAQSKIDYWMPIDVSIYNGKNVKLSFIYANKNDIGLSKIKQSSTFDFDYNETYRPLFHATPEYGWMNDPNGMVYHNGEYHLFFQFNPYGSRWANMHWGHLISKDLVSWQMLPFVLEPDSLGSIFSGSAVIDKDNTAGFGKDAMVAIYTSSGKVQTQSIAYSLDNGRTFTKYEDNPVLGNPDIADFRDPKVFWHSDSKQWIMTLATKQTITFYGSKNLKEWSKLSEFGEGIGAHGGVWECPDLIPLEYNGKTKWVLFVSINPGGPNGGSATQYFIGNFDGKTFTPDTLPYPIWLDYGRDNYAGVTWSNVPESEGRTLFIGWMSNWDYSNFTPQTNFRGAMTLARELKLVHNGEHLVLANSPVREIESLREKKNIFETTKIDKSQTVKNILGNGKKTYEIEMTIKPEQASNFGFALANSKGEKISFSFDLKKKTFGVDRSKSGITDFGNDFAHKVSEAPLIKKNVYTIRLFVDKSSIECFINGGELVQTNIVFPTEVYNTLEFSSDSEIIVEDLTLYQIK